MEEEIVLSCTRCGRLFYISKAEGKSLSGLVSDVIWEVADFARNFKCWQCLQVMEFEQIEGSSI
jgi:hypothetical protein